MLAEGDPLDVNVLVLQRAGLVVVDLVVADRELLPRRNHPDGRAFPRRGRRVTLKLLDRLRLEGSRRLLGQVERLEDELARLPLLPCPHVLGARQIERSLARVMPT